MLECLKYLIRVNEYVFYTPSTCLNRFVTCFQRTLIETNVTGVDWIPVELELVDKIWLPDTEILRLKGFHSLSVLGRLQVGKTPLAEVTTLL